MNAPRMWITGAVVVALCGAAAADSFDYGTVTVTGGSESGNLAEIWDLTAGPLTISFTADLTGMVDAAGAHAWAELGVRQVGGANFNPGNPGGQGVWLATDYEWVANTFDPDPPGSPAQDLDDKLILQREGGHGEGDYDLPSVPPNPWANHRIWFDRDGVDPSQAQHPLAVDGGTYNTAGRYEIVMTLSSTGPGTGQAFMTVNGLAQGFETDNDWSTMELSPAGMTFTGTMTHMQVFYGLYGYGAAHSASFEDIQVEGTLIPAPPAAVLGVLGLTAVGMCRRLWAGRRSRSGK